MSITQNINFEQLLKEVEIKAKRDNHRPENLYWVYYDYDGNLKGCTARTWNVETQKKEVKPWVLENGKWKSKGFCGKKKSIYGLEQLKNHSKKPILFVEGEKTADAGKELFPNFNVVSWLGGSGAVAKIDLTHFHNMNIYLLPDKDEPGYKAMEILSERLLDQDNKIFKVPVHKLPDELIKGWDIADLYSDHGVVSTEEVIDLVTSAKEFKRSFNLIDKQTFPDLSERGNPINTTDNIAHLLDFYKTKVRYNEMTNYPEFYCPGKKFSSVNEADCHFTEISNLCVKTGVPKVDLASHLLLVADRNRYHPACDFILSKPWDGISRIKEFNATIQAENQELADKLIYRWMLGAVAAPFSDKGIALDGCLVIQGKQRIGKTHWFLNLVPENYRNLIKAGLRLDPDSKDSVMDCTQCWLGELGEADGTIRKSHVSAQKQFLTKSLDYYRVPFGKRIREVPRRSAFYGSVNPKNYLADDTGNRRYWSVTATYINHNHGIDMQQVWAEFKVLLDSGESYRLTDHEHDLLNQSNKEFELIEPLEETLKARFNWDKQPQQYKSCTQILQIMGYDKPTKGEVNKLAAILINKGIQRGTGSKRRDFHIPFEYMTNADQRF